MQLFLGLFLFSVLLTAGSSLVCEVCSGSGNDCSGSKVTCSGSHPVCMTLKTEITAGAKLQTTMKFCSTEETCKKYEELKGKGSSGGFPDVQSDVPNIPVGASIKDVVCSKASPSLALFFPAFFGLLLMKLLL